MGIGASSFLESIDDVLVDVGKARVPMSPLFYKVPSGPAVTPKNAQPDMTDEKFDDIRKAASKEFGINTQKDINIGICGGRKSGKSRLINAIRRKDAAPTDQKLPLERPTPYRLELEDPEDITHVVLWEIPPTTTGNINEFINKHRLMLFDCLVIMTTGRDLRQEEIDLALGAKKWNVPFVFVRSQCDEVLRKMSFEHLDGRTNNNLEAVVRVKQMFHADASRIVYKTLLGSELGKFNDVYFISCSVLEKISWDKWEMDEDKLMSRVMVKATWHRYAPEL